MFIVSTIIYPYKSPNKTFKKNYYKMQLFKQVLLIHFYVARKLHCKNRLQKWILFAWFLNILYHIMCVYVSSEERQMSFFQLVSLLCVGSLNIWVHARVCFILHHLSPYFLYFLMPHDIFIESMRYLKHQSNNYLIIKNLSLF